MKKYNLQDDILCKTSIEVVLINSAFAKAVQLKSLLILGLKIYANAKILPGKGFTTPFNSILIN